MLPPISRLVSHGLASCALLISSPGGRADDLLQSIPATFERAATQYDLLLESVSDDPQIPRTFVDGKVVTVRPKDWTSGFIAGTLWRIYEHSRDPKWLAAATDYTTRLDSIRNYQGSHDVGFMLGCSYGHAYRITRNPAYRQVMVEGAASLATRFDPKVGLIRSWDHGSWSYPVIIDNMMNLEFLMSVARESGQSRFMDIALAHADGTLKHHFRDDASSVHVVDFDPSSGGVIAKKTHQGAADDSAWARGQAWALYGFTMMFRETGNQAYLDQAVKVARFIIDHPRLPADKVPYWDFDAPGIPDAPRDASAAAIMSSALIELSTLVEAGKGDEFLSLARQQLSSLSSPAYLAAAGENGGFLLLHSTGHLPKNSEVDVPINYADYYFLEALTRYRALAQSPAVDVGAIDRDRILKAAEKAITLAPLTLTTFRAELSEGGPNDFYSNGDYWWPDPASPDGLPYIQRDGETNPGNFNHHRLAILDLRDAVAALAAAYRISGEDRYATKAAELLRVFFLDPATRMNPHLKYAQAIPGRTPGRGIGIIDTLHLIEIPVAVAVLEAAPSFPTETGSGLRKWFADYLGWMTTSKNGMEEAATKNNHAVAYDLQTAVFARFIGDEARLAECRRRFKEVFVSVQMAPDGSFPAELGRTKPYAYSIFQLDNLTTLCHVLSRPGEDLWKFELPDGRGIRKAVAYLQPYLADKSKWPLPPDVQAWNGWPSRAPSLLFAGIALKQDSLVDLWRGLPTDPSDPEVRRNIAITQPLLWIQPTSMAK